MMHWIVSKAVMVRCWNVVLKATLAALIRKSRQAGARSVTGPSTG